MARSLQLLSSVLLRVRDGALCPLSTVTLSRCRFISKGPNIKPWAKYHPARAQRHRDEMSDGEHELEDVEDRIQQVMDKEVQRQKSVKYHIVRRQMTPRGPPERKLTWDAMEEIRHLKREQPEEWTVDRLAEGFSVSTDVIYRVIRSKHIPNPERKAKQDAKVMIKLKQQALPSGPRVALEKHRLTSGPTRAALSSESGNKALVLIDQKDLISQSEQSPAAFSIVTKKEFSDITKHSTETAQMEIQQKTESTEKEEEDEDWDGQILSEADIEELITVKTTPVIKEGDSFFDVDGIFLYRI